MSKPNTVERVGYEVIDRKLLHALEDASQVAILLTKEDLDVMIACLYGYVLAEKVGNVLHMEKFHLRRKSLAAGLEQLREEAFGK
jgi:hypothetical protein